jgi:DNA-binding response OmpR family regulator
MVGRRKRVGPSEWRHQDRRPRVLIENTDSGIAFATEKLLLDRGYDVSTCTGPGERTGKCPLVADGECASVNEADVILFSLRLSQESGLAVLRGLRAAVPETPIVVELPQPQVAAHAADLAGCHILPLPYTRKSICATIDAALSGEDPGEPTH